MRRRHHRALVAALGAASAAALMTGASLGADRAVAVLEEVAETGRPGLLSLRAAPASPQWRELRPGDTVHWPIEASLDGADASTLALELRAEGALVDAAGLTASVTACDAPFSPATSSPPACHDGGSVVLAETALALLDTESARRVLADLRLGAPRYLLIALHVPASVEPAAVAGASAAVAVGLHAAGESAPTGSVGAGGAASDRLPVTGGDLTALGLLGAGLVGLGTALTLRRAPKEAP